MHRPVYAEMRRTGTPEYIGATPEDPNPGSGATMDPNTHGITFDDKMRLLQSGRHNQLGFDAMKYLATGIPDTKSAVYIHPDPTDPRATMAVQRHEAIHDVLNKSGVTNTDYSNMMQANPDTMGKLQNTFTTEHPNYRKADPATVGSEMSAYLGANHKDMFTPPTDLRTAGLKVIQDYLDKNHPTAGKKYRSMIKDYNK